MPARVNNNCIHYHGGEKAPVVHGYATSQHGVIYRLDEKYRGWSKSLSGANYRTPACGCFHLHQGNHNISPGAREEIMEKYFKNMLEKMRAVRQDCQAPHYMTRLFENGEAMLDVGRMKVQKVSVLLRQARSEFSKQALIDAEQQLKSIRSRHLKNILLGTGRQSPVYQWWHGHPALDADLLRSKGVIGELRRQKAIASARHGQDPTQKIGQ